MKLQGWPACLSHCQACQHLECQQFAERCNVARCESPLRAEELNVIAFLLCLVGKGVPWISEKPAQSAYGSKKWEFKFVLGIILPGKTEIVIGHMLPMLGQRWQTRSQIKHKTTKIPKRVPIHCHFSAGAGWQTSGLVKEVP